MNKSILWLRFLQGGGSFPINFPLEKQLHFFLKKERDENTKHLLHLEELPHACEQWDQLQPEERTIVLKLFFSLAIILAFSLILFTSTWKNRIAPQRDGGRGVCLGCGFNVFVPTLQFTFSQTVPDASWTLMADQKNLFRRNLLLYIRFILFSEYTVHRWMIYSKKSF